MHAQIVVGQSERRVANDALIDKGDVCLPALVAILNRTVLTFLHPVLRYLYEQYGLD